MKYLPALIAHDCVRLCYRVACSLTGGKQSRCLSVAWQVSLDSVRFVSSCCELPPSSKAFTLSLVYFTVTFSSVRLEKERCIARLCFLWSCWLEHGPLNEPQSNTNTWEFSNSLASDATKHWQFSCISCFFFPLHSEFHLETANVFYLRRSRRWVSVRCISRQPGQLENVKPCSRFAFS